MWYMNEEREMLVKAFREFAQNEIRPVIAKMEEDEVYPREVFEKMGELGMLGFTVDEKFGGAGVDYINQGLLLEEIAKESHAFGLLTMLNTQLTTTTLFKICSPEQIEKYVKPGLEGKILWSLASTEACGATNHPEFETTAVIDGDDIVINGSKVLITNADVADYHIVNCVSGEFNPMTMEGVSVVIVPANTEGIKIGHMENKLGWHGSHTGQIYFNNVRVPKENVIGEFNKGLAPLSLTMTPEFVSYGPMNLGAMEAVYDKTVHYLKNRIQRGKSLWDTYEVTRNEMARIKCKIDNYRHAVYGVLENKNQGKYEVAMEEMIALKVEGEKLLSEIAGECIEFHGGTGTVYETGIERYYRDSKMGALGCSSNKSLINMLSMMI